MGRNITAKEIQNTLPYVGNERIYARAMGVSSSKLTKKLTNKKITKEANVKLRCRINYHRWTKWHELKINKAKGDFWNYKKYDQTKQCLDCKKLVVREV